MEFKDLIEYCGFLKAQYAQRNAMCMEMEDMVMMSWDEENTFKSKMENTRVTKSPDARNALRGAARLLLATEPQISIPYDENNDQARQTSEKLEEAASTIWQVAGRVRGDPVHYDIVNSALLYDEFVISITDTEELVKYGKGQAPAVRAQFESIARRTPYLIDVINPQFCYPDRNQYGLRAMYIERSMTVSEARQQFGKTLVLDSVDYSNPFKELTICDYMDAEIRVVWVDGERTPFINAPHKLPFIPYVCHRVEGGRLFSQPEYQNQPFLYGVWKSGIWNRKNMLLSSIFTMVYAMALNPLFIQKLSPSGQGVEMSFETPGGLVTVPYGGDFSPMMSKGIIDPSVLQSLELVDRMMEESTIYSQTLGEPMGKNAAFSMVALLHQAGRLPLLAPQRKSGWGIGDALRIALLWQRHKAKDAKTNYAGRKLEIAHQDIPEDLEIEAKLDVNLPQDNLQNAQIATSLAGGESPLVSQEWVRENVLNIGQSSSEVKRIWSERAARMMFEQALQMFMMQAQQQMQQAPPEIGGNPPQMGQPQEQPGMVSGPPPGQGMPPIQPQQPIPSPGMPKTGAPNELA
jgi:hypothetical protein